MILGRSLSRNARLFPEKPAIVVAGGRTLTYRELNERVNRLAAALHARGLSRGKTLATLSRNSAEYLEVYFAAGLAGTILVPINLHLKADDVAARLEHSGADGLIVDAEFLPLLSEVKSGSVLNSTWCIGKPTDRFQPYEHLCDEGSGVLPDFGVQPEDILYLGYTSGTTGPSKAARISHRAVVVGYLYKAVAYGLGSDDITLNPGPFWHSAPRDYSSLAIYLGGTCVVTRSFRPKEFLQLVERHRVTNSFLVPTMLQMLVDLPGNEQYDCSSLRVMLSGGSPLPGAVRDRVIRRFGPILHEFYGATETRMITTISAREMQSKPRSVGVPFPDVEVVVLDESGRSVQSGQVGEIFVRGPGIFSGYHSDPERTQESMRGDWFSLGDMGKVDADGYLYLVDRKQDMIISGGENIYPNDIEDVLLSCPGVKEAAVIGIPDTAWGELVTAVIVPSNGSLPDADEVIEICAQRLPSYMKPRRVEFCEALPRSANGKILRKVLRELYRTHNRVKERTT